MSTKIREVTRMARDSDPGAVWNAFVDLIAVEKYADLNDVQRPAHLAFWYESELLNGGHLQYFENWGLEPLEEKLLALGALGADAQAVILKEAADRWRSQARSPIETPEVYSETAMLGEFDDLDDRFYKCRPEITELLEVYLRKNQSAFVLIV